MTAVPTRCTLAARGIGPMALALALLVSCDKGGSGGAETTTNLFTVTRGDLPITVKENAELQALRETIVRSEIEGQSTVIYIIPEGTSVKQGEKLVELDVSELVEKRANQAIAVAKAEAGLSQAKKELEILEKELTTKMGTAESALRIAELELEKLLGKLNPNAGPESRNGEMVRKLRDLTSIVPTRSMAEQQGGEAVVQVDPRSYAGLVNRAVELLRIDGSEVDPMDRSMGDMANQILEAADLIRLAMSDLKVKEDTYFYSQKLAAKQFITRTELEKDKLAFQSQMSKVTLAWNDLDLLVNYTLAKERIKLKQDVDNASLELDRVIGANEAARNKADSALKSAQAEYDLAAERLTNLERQIKNAVVFAPTPGLVVYARIDRDRRGGEAVREGIQVRERQDLIILPDTTKMRCVIKVQEAQVDKVQRGQPAYIQVEAFPGETFTGRVTSVAPVADSNSGWMTSDRKVYTSIVELDGDNPDARIRSRMAAAVTIVIDVVKDTLPVPLQAVRRDRSVNYVWKQTQQGPQAVAVKVGRQSTERVEVLEGLAAGDQVWLTPPPDAQEPKFPQPEAPVPSPLAPNAAEPTKAGPGTAAAPAPGAGSSGAAAQGAPNEQAQQGGQPTAGGQPPAGGQGQGGSRRGGMFSNKKLAEMTPEELEQFKSGLGMMGGMVTRLRDQGQEERAAAMETALQTVQQALDKNDLPAAQAAVDAMRASMGRGRPGGGGAGGGQGGGGQGPGGGN